MNVTSDINLLAGKRIAFITAGYPGKRFIYEKANTLDVEITIIDSPESWSRHLVHEGIIKNFVGVDFGQSSEILVSTIKTELENRGIILDGVCTFAELSLPITAKLAKELGLPGHDPVVVRTTRDKHKVRKVVAGAGLSEVRSFKIKSLESEVIESAAEHVGFPSVLKPISGADSLGVKRVNNIDELRSAVNEAQEIVSTLIVDSGALARLTTPTGSDPGVPSPQKSANRFIKLDLSLEEYLEGPEVDVDIVMYDSKCYFASVVDNGPTVEPYFAETWNLCPSLLPQDKQIKLVNEALATLKALGFESGVFHVEEKYTSRGPRIIEVNARMGGGPIRLQHKYVYGIDLVVEQLLLCIGQAPSQCLSSGDNLIAQPQKSFVSATPNVSKSGIIKSTKFLDAIRDREDLVGLWEFVSAGDAVIGPEDGQPSWLCEIALGGFEGSQVLLEKMLELQASIIKNVETHYYD
jgi:hypothetical protein